MDTSVDSSLLEALERDNEKRSLIESGVSVTSRASISSRRRDRCYFWASALCGASFLLLGTPVAVLGATASAWRTSYGAYVAGGTAELVLGACLVLRLVLQCFHCLPRRRKAGEAAGWVLFVTLTLIFLVWCTVVCSFCVAVAWSAVNYSGDTREAVDLALSCASLVVGFAFGVSVCCWAGCPAD